MDVGYNYRCDVGSHILQTHSGVTDVLSDWQWWSLGVLLFEMCYGWSPFYAETRVEEYERILSGEIKIPNKRGYSVESRDLLLKVRALSCPP